MLPKPGYGHKPLRTIGWSLVVILIGWPIVWMAKHAGVMRPTWPENIPHSSEPDYEELHSLLYSLDAFLPFVNLHQEHYWWPNAKASGDCVVFGRRFRLRGSLVRGYDEGKAIRIAIAKAKEWAASRE
jgi:hypothetical protein